MSKLVKRVTYHDDYWQCGDGCCSSYDEIVEVEFSDGTVDSEVSYSYWNAILTILERNGVIFEETHEDG